MATSQIYIISEGYQGPVKVGRSKNAGYRLCALQTGNPRPLNLVATWDLDHDRACDLERIIREEWDYRAISGEWYEADQGFAIAYVQDAIKAHGLVASAP